MRGTLVRGLKQTVKQLLGFVALFCFLVLTACTKANPTLTALSSETNGFDLKLANEKIYSSSGTLKLTGVCDARLKDLKIKIGESEWKPLAEAIDPNEPTKIDCTSRSIGFSLPHSIFGFDPTALSEGESARKEIQISGKSEFGSVSNQKFTVTFVKDSTAPTVTLDSKLTINAAEAPTYLLTGSCETGPPVTLTYDATTVSIPCANQRFAQRVDFSTRADSAVTALTVSVTQTDAAGNASAAVAIQPLLDKTAPDFTVTSIVPAQPTGLTSLNLGTATISGRCESGREIRMTSPVAGSLTCPSGSSTYNLAYPANLLPENANAFDVTFEQSDASGNVTTRSVSVAYKDTVAGTATLSIARAHVNSTNTFTGTCTNGQGAVRVTMLDSASTSRVVTSAACANGGWSIADTSVSTLAEGTISVSAVQVDSYGNLSTAVTGSFVLDRTAPTLQLTTVPTSLNRASTQANIVISGSCETGTSMELVITAGTVVTQPATCASSAWSATFSVSALLNGTTTSMTITVRSTDSAANVGSVARTLQTDFIAPNLVSQAPNVQSYINNSNQSNFTFSGVCQSGDPAVVVALSGSSTSLGTIACGTSNTYSGGVNLSSLSDGLNTFVISQTDALGNKTEVSVEVMKDVVSPTPPTSLGNLALTNSKALSVTPTFAPVGGLEVASATASGFDHYALTFRLQSLTTVLGERNYAANETAAINVLTSFSADSIYAVDVVAIDKAGNSSTVFTDTWDYCPLRTFTFKPGTNAVNAGDTYTNTFRVPKACAQGTIVIHARGEAGRDSSGAYQAVYGGGGVASGLFSGTSLAQRNLSLKFAGAGLGGGALAGSAASTNANSGGRYAWVESAAATSLLRVVAGGGGGMASNVTVYPNKPGQGGDQGYGEGPCEDNGDRAYCGQNGNFATTGSSYVSGAAGAPGSTVSGCPAGLAGQSSDATINAGFGGNAGNITSGREAGGGGGGWGGGGAGGGGYFSGICYGRSGGGGGSLVSGSARVATTASGLVAGLNHGLPEVRITIGLPASPCVTGFTYIPPNGDLLNTSSTNSELGFCLANVEGNLSTGVATFTAGVAPSSAVTRVQASNACAAIAPTSGVTKLPSNTQWQAVANIVHWTKENWSLRYPGMFFSSSNFLYSGNNLSTTALGAAATVTTNTCAGTNSSNSACTTSTESAYRRTHQLGNSSTNIWDLGGNLSEWVNDDMGTSGTYSNIYISAMSKETSYLAPLMPSSDYSLWSSTSTSARFGLGLASMSTIPVGAGVIRGGSVLDSSTDVGVFRADLTKTSSQAPSGVGFRCVHDFAAPGF